MAYLFLIFIFGLLVGSFLNLIIDRLPRDEQIIIGRSKCDFCSKTLSWYDLIPVFSWVYLKGKCRYCRSPIPARNLAVELITGTLFVLIFFFPIREIFNFQFSIFNLFSLTALLYSIETLINFFIISSLIVIFFIDLKHRIIPDKVIYFAILASFFAILYARSYILFSNNMLSAVGAALFFLFLVLITKGKGMGIGDIKLAFFMGLFLGFPKVVYALYFAFLTGAFFSVILILLGRKRFGQTIAFGPFLVLGTLFAYFNLLNSIIEKIW